VFISVHLRLKGFFVVDSWHSFPTRFLALLLTISLLLACRPPDSAQPTTVTFAYFGDPAEQAAFISVVEGFHATLPQSDGVPIRIETNAVPSQADYLTRLTTDFAAGAPPDVSLFNYRRMAQYYNRGALEVLDGRAQESTVLDLSGFYPAALDAFRNSADEVVCLPQNISSQVVYYNRELFDAAGLAYPAPEWSWQAFRQTALALTQPDTDGDGEADQHGLGLEPQLIRMAPFIWQNGGELVDDPAAPTRLALDAPITQEAIRFVADLALVDQVVPSRNAEAVQSHRDRFYGGKIAMYIDSRRIVPTLRELAQFDWDVAPLPTGKRAASVLHSDGYCLAAASEVKDAAWAFIEYALSAEGQIRAAQLGRTVPSLRSVAESSAFLDATQPPASAQVWLDIAPQLRALPKLEKWVTIERVAAIELEQLYLGAQTLEATIGNIQSASLDGFVPIK
jgi:multiple sugar transport system substrate-binding protein